MGNLADSLSAAFAARPDPAAVPAASVAVVQDRNEVAAAWGADNRTLFQAASISKPVAAFMVLRLTAQGKLSLDADVNEYLTSWQLPGDNRKPPVTVRHLLCHSGALTVSGVPGYQQGQTLPSLTEILDGLPPANTPAVRRDGPPGHAHRYSGGGYVILQQLLENVTAQTFPDLAAELIFEPARMTTATYAVSRPAKAATAHVNGREVDWHVHPELAAAGLWCTPTDLVRFARVIQDAVAGQTDALLPRHLAREMVTPQVDGWGLGLRLSDHGAHQRFSHGGYNYGYKCVVIGAVHRAEAVSVMTGSDRGSPAIGSLLAAVRENTSWRDLPDSQDGPTW
jgi:CubicO group peptidase (beta-lactamase class C family)